MSDKWILPSLPSQEEGSYGVTVRVVGHGQRVVHDTFRTGEPPLQYLCLVFYVLTRRGKGGD